MKTREDLPPCVIPLWIEAGERHARWIGSRAANFEGKPDFARGPHPAEHKRKWMPLEPEETRRGTWIFTDASRGSEDVGVGIVKIENGNEVSRIGRRLPDDYPVDIAELWALRPAVFFQE